MTKNKPNSSKLSQQKISKKPVKSLRGVPEYYDEVKQRYCFSLTPTARKQLNKLAQEKKLSVSELIEQIARGIILSS